METPEKESTSTWKTNHNTLKDGAGSRVGALKRYTTMDCTGVIDVGNV